MTGYVRLDLPNRSHDDYKLLGQRLLGAAETPRVVFDDFTLDDCWLWRLSDGASLPVGNPDKDTREFHTVQHQKTSWMCHAAEQSPADLFVWMDYGLLHVPGITEDAVRRFLERCADAPTDRVGMASIWGHPADAVPPGPVAWWCAGGVFVVPRALVAAWHGAVVREAALMRAAGYVTWEVNTWANAWRRNPHLVRAWACDHDATLLENGPW